MKFRYNWHVFFKFSLFSKVFSFSGHFLLDKKSVRGNFRFCSRVQQLIFAVQFCFGCRTLHQTYFFTWIPSISWSINFPSIFSELFSERIFITWQLSKIDWNTRDVTISSRFHKKNCVSTSLWYYSIVLKRWKIFQYVMLIWFFRPFPTFKFPRGRYQSTHKTTASNKMSIRFCEFFMRKALQSLSVKCHKHFGSFCKIRKGILNKKNCLFSEFLISRLFQRFSFKGLFGLDCKLKKVGDLTK